MQLLFGHDEQVAKFVADLVPRVRGRGFGECVAIGVINSSCQLVAGMVFSNWWPEANTIEMSGASITPKWMTRGILDRLFSYAFDEVGVQMIVTRNAASNVRLHRQLQRYGFDRFDIPRLMGRHEDGVIWTLTEETFRASRFHRGQTRPAQAA